MTDKKDTTERKIKDFVDKHGEPVEVWWKLRLEGAPCVDIIFETFAELIRKGWCNQTVTIDNSHRVVYAKYPNGDVAGGIAYKWVENTNSIWITLSFTNPKYRGRGINGLCHQVMEGDAKVLGATSIESYVHVENASRLKSTEKVGLSAKFYRMFKPIS